MPKAKMPEPVAWLSHVTLETLSKGKSVTAYPNETTWLADGLVTRGQAEAYANERVREALEAAAKVVEAGVSEQSSIVALFARRNAASEIRSLVPNS